MKRFVSMTFLTFLMSGLTGLACADEKDAKAIVDAAGLAVAPTVLRERIAYRAAWPLGSAAVENEPYGKGAQEISER